MLVEYLLMPMKMREDFGIIIRGENEFNVIVVFRSSGILYSGLFLFSISGCGWFPNFV